MYTCSTCGARYHLGTTCADCERVAELLGRGAANAAFLIGWVRAVVYVQVEEHIDRWHRDHQDD